MTGEFPAQRANNAGNVSIWWRHHYTKDIPSAEHGHAVVASNQLVVTANILPHNNTSLLRTSGISMATVHIFRHWYCHKFNTIALATMHTNPRLHSPLLIGGNGHLRRLLSISAWFLTGSSGIIAQWIWVTKPAPHALPFASLKIHRNTVCMSAITCTIMMTSSNGNIFRVTGPLCGEFTGPGEFPAQRPVTRSFDVFLYLRLNKRLSKQPWGWFFETPSWSLWRESIDLHVSPQRQ